MPRSLSTLSIVRKKLLPWAAWTHDVRTTIARSPRICSTATFAGALGDAVQVHGFGGIAGLVRDGGFAAENVVGRQVDQARRSVRQCLGKVPRPVGVDARNLRAVGFCLVDRKVSGGVQYDVRLVVIDLPLHQRRISDIELR